MENFPRQFSGVCVAGIARTAELFGMTPLLFHYRFQAHIQLRFCSLSSCHDILHDCNVLATRKMSQSRAVCCLVIRVIALLDHLVETAFWVDKEQMESFMYEYRHSSDKKQFIMDKKEHYVAISKVCFINQHLVRPSDSVIITARPSMRKMANQ